MSIKPAQAEFECPYCGHKWIAKHSDIKMLSVPANGNHWTRLYTPCPMCKREVSNYIKENN